MNTQDLKYQQKSKFISSPEQNYFVNFAMRYPVFPNLICIEFGLHLSILFSIIWTFLTSFWFPAGFDMTVYWCHSSEYGSRHDSDVMTHSRLYHKFVHQNYRPFPQAVLLADSAYEGKVIIHKSHCEPFLCNRW